MCQMKSDGKVQVDREMVRAFNRMIDAVTDRSIPSTGSDPMEGKLRQDRRDMLREIVRSGMKQEADEGKALDVLDTLGPVLDTEWS